MICVRVVHDAGKGVFLSAFHDARTVTPEVCLCLGKERMKNDNGLIALYEKEKALRERIIKAKAEQQKRAAAQRKALAEIIGGALIGADLAPDLKSSITAILAGAGLEDRAIRLLRDGGWL